MYNIVKYKRSRLSQLGIQQHIPERVDQSVANARINRLGCFVHFYLRRRTSLHTIVFTSSYSYMRLLAYTIPNLMLLKMGTSVLLPNSDLATFTGTRTLHADLATCTGTQGTAGGVCGGKHFTF
jgi:hypothetical protein